MEDPEAALRKSRTKALIRHARAVNAIFDMHEQREKASPGAPQGLRGGAALCLARCQNSLPSSALMGSPAPVRDWLVPVAPGTIAALIFSYMRSVSNQKDAIETQRTLSNGCQTQVRVLPATSDPAFEPLPMAETIATTR